MKPFMISLLLAPIAAFGLSPIPNYTAIYEKADIFVEGHLSGKQLDKIKVSTSYNSTMGAGRDEFYIMTELIVDGRIQFNGQVIAPDGYLQIDGKEKEFYKVYAKDGAHLNEANTKETKAWFISRSALPRGNSMFCLGASQIDYAERNISEYMSNDIGSQETSQDIRKKKEYRHGGDLMFSSDQLESISVIFAEETTRVRIVARIPAESIIYQIKKNPNLDPDKDGKPEISSLHLYIDDHLIAEDCIILISDPSFSTAKAGKTELGFSIKDESDTLLRLSKLVKRRPNKTE